MGAQAKGQEAHLIRRVWLGVFSLNLSLLGFIQFFDNAYVFSLVSVVLSLLSLVFSRIKKFYSSLLYLPFTYISVLFLNVFSTGGYGGFLFLGLATAFCVLFTPKGFEQKKYVAFGLIGIVADIAFSINANSISLLPFIASLCLVILEFSGFVYYWLYRQHLKIKYLEQREQKSQSLQVLLGVFCHDLSTPMMAISLICFQKRHSPDLSDDEKAAWNEVHHLIERERYLIENIRKVEKIASGVAETMELNQMHPREIYDKLEEVFGERLKGKSINLEIDVREEEAGSLLFLADENLLIYNILTNLMTNAIKFTERGRSIILGAYRIEGDIALYVEDQGEGMSQENVENLLRGNILRSTKIGTENEKGTGLGIKIVKNFVEVLGGKLLIQSRPRDSFPDDHGTRFEVRFKAVSEEGSHVA